MKLAFLLFHYFPHGGLQRDFYRIAEECQKKGHEIHAYCMKWVGEKPNWLHLHIIQTRGQSNHVRCKDFASKALAQAKESQTDCVIGFNRMPGLDIYFAADTCFANKNSLRKYPFLKLLPRYKTFLEMEKAVFNPNEHCKILSISSKEKLIYQKTYQTPENRFIELPPGVNKNRVPNEHSITIRQQYRQQFQIKNHEFVLLSIGSSFRTKGVDRVLQAIANLPSELRTSCQYIVAGQEKHLRKYKKLAQTLHLEQQVHFLGARDDVPELLWMADFLVHAARAENAGLVITEALAAHLPVIVTGNCGYARYVKEANAGMVLPEPFRSNDLTHAIAQLLDYDKLHLLRQNAEHYTKDHDLFSMVTQAAGFILS